MRQYGRQGSFAWRSHVNHCMGMQIMANYTVYLRGDVQSALLDNIKKSRPVQVTQRRC